MYKQFCDGKQIEFKLDNNVSPYDDTTLFCPAGMQQFKSHYSNPNYKGTISNIQSCLRLNDIDEIGDGSHLLYFNMIGLFSFREMTLIETIDFFMGFLLTLNIVPDYVTIHPDKKEWINHYSKYNIEVRLDSECIWSDGNIGGYCTEFYKNGIEIGNIVNTLGDCIDVGFGKERLEMILNNTQKSKEDTLKETILKIIESGYRPSGTKQGSILRKLLRICVIEDIHIDHQFYHDEVKRQERMILKYDKLKSKHTDKDDHWWYDTHGIDLSIIKKRIN